MQRFSNKNTKIYIILVKIYKNNWNNKFKDKNKGKKKFKNKLINIPL